MKVVKRILCLVLLLCAFVLVGCNDNKVRIGIIQYVTDGALDDARNGIIEGLKEAGFVDGENAKITVYNPQAKADTLADMARRALKKNDYVFAIATPVAQALKAAAADLESDAQIFFTAVTDPVASGIITSNTNPGGNITGTNDMNPVEFQVGLIKDLFPDREVNTLKLGVIYTPSENNSVIQVNLVKAECTRLGITLIEQTVAQSTDIANAVEYLKTRVDAIYLPTDNLVAANVFSITSVANASGVPTICGEASMLNNGGTIAYGVNYITLGKMTGLMAARVINGEVSKAGDIPSTGMAEADFTLAINVRDGAEGGIVVPQELQERADTVIR